MKSIGILGGTFDPVHLGHISLAESALKQIKLERVLFMPANKQPFKADKFTEDPSDRLKMIELSIRNNKNLGITDIELKSKGISYTYDTLLKLMPLYGEVNMYFILGSDSLLKIESWYKGKELLRLCSFAVGLRPEDDRGILRKEADRLSSNYNCNIILLDDIMKPISSTVIREHIQDNKSISGLVDAEVEKYIYEHRLYI
ncbi:MAG: nicotinate (nicotinamide) nucleotide adenylyltransferase [Eubacterium sp.]|nr:nicotinate (nicotinamide) nucleotide adenylyltransferase [Eubacterium sp.]